MADREMKVKLSFDVSKFEEGIKKMDKNMRLLDSQIKASTSSFESFGRNTDSLKAKADGLSKKIEIQKDKVSALTEAYNNSVAEKGKDSDATRKLEIKLNNATTSLNKMKTELKLVNDQLKNQPSLLTNLNSSLDKFNNKLSTLGTKVTSVGTKLTAGLTAPVIALGTTAVKSVVSFEDAFAGVEKTVNGTVEQLANIETGIRNMAKEIPSSREEIAGVAEVAGQLGIQTDNILKFTRTIIDLGNATNLVGEEGASQLAKFANIVQMNQENFDRLGSTVVALGNNFATTEKDIVNMSTRLAGAGSQIGLTEAEILAFATTLSSVGIEAEAGGSAFSKLMINIQLATEKGGKELKQFADVAGMSSKEFAKAFKEDASSAISAFIKGLGESEKKGKTTIAVLDEMGISEVRLRDTMLRLAGSGDLLNNALELGSTAWTENNALTNEANKRYETLASKLQIMKNVVSDAGMVIGEKLVPYLSKGIDFISGLAEKISALNPEQVELLVKAMAGLVTIGPAVAGLGKSMTILAPMSNKLGDAIQKVEGLGTKGIELGKKFGTSITEGLSKAGTGINNFLAKDNKVSSMLNGLRNKAVTFGGSFKDAFSRIANIQIPDKQINIPFIDNIVTKVQGLAPQVQTAFGKLGGVANKSLGKLQQIAQIALKMVGPVAIVGLALTGLGLLEQNFGEQIQHFANIAIERGPTILQNLINGIVGKLPDLINLGVNLLLTLVDTIVVNLPIVIQGAVQIITALAEGVVANLDKIIQAILSLVETVLMSIIENLPMLLEAGLKILMGLVDGVVNNIDKIIDMIMNVLLTLITVIITNLPKIIEAGIKILVALIEGLAKAIPKLIEYLPTIIETIFKAFGQIDWAELGKSIIRGLVSGLKALGNLIWDTLKGIGQAALNGFKKMFGIASPSKVFEGFGENIDEGFVQGIEAKEKDVANSLQSLRKLADGSFESTYDYNLNVMKKDFDIAKAGTGNNISTTNNNSMINIIIEKVENYRQQDVKELVDEISFYLKKNKLALGGT